MHPKRKAENAIAILFEIYLFPYLEPEEFFLLFSRGWKLKTPMIAN